MTVDRATLEAQLSGGLPADLVSELLDAYEELGSEYCLGHLRAALLAGGRFAEAAFRLLEQEIGGKHTPVGQPLPRMDALLQRLAQDRTHDRFMKIDIPRLLCTVYAIRNGRGIAHLSDDIDANRMDASLVLAVCSWVVAEFIRRYHGCLAEEAQAIVDELVERQVPIIADMDGVLRVLRPKMRYKDQILVLLYERAGTWVSAADLLAWTEYSNSTRFKNRLLRKLHKERLIEYRDDQCMITSLGVQYVETDLNVGLA